MKEYFDNNPESRPYLERLEAEWNQHGKIIIAVDYDDTISPWKLQGFDPKRTIEVLKVAKQTGAYLVVFTACKADRYPEIIRYCESIGLEIDTINKAPIDLPYGNDSKIYANIFIDDRAGLNEALQILEFAAYRIRGSRQNIQSFDF
jgi:thiol-disulfide isomerase/thioredoxin